MSYWNVPSIHGLRALYLIYQDVNVSVLKGNFSRQQPQGHHSCDRTYFLYLAYIYRRLQRVMTCDTNKRGATPNDT